MRKIRLFAVVLAFLSAAGMFVRPIEAARQPSGSEWFEMTGGEKLACVALMVDYYKKGGISLSKAYYEYVSDFERFLMRHPERIGESIEPSFVSMISEADPEARRVLESLKKGA